MATRERNNGFLLPFLDMLLAIVLSLLVNLFLAMMLINPPDSKHDIELKTEYRITLSWPDESFSDIDIYVEDPAGNLVWFQNREQGVMALDRDDRGGITDTVVDTQGKKITVPLNEEHISIRGIVSGEYVVNAHVWRLSESGSVPVTIQAEKINNPGKGIIHIATHDLHMAEEKTYFRFKLKQDGTVYDVNQLPKKLKVAGGTYQGDSPFGPSPPLNIPDPTE
jgi:hypothetical protein